MATENRQGENQYTKEDRSESEQSSKKRIDKASMATGKSTDTLSKARQIVKAATVDPQKYDDLKEKMEV